jgi:hypothetical protein
MYYKMKFMSFRDVVVVRCGGGGNRTGGTSLPILVRTANPVRKVGEGGRPGSNYWAEFLL